MPQLADIITYWNSFAIDKSEIQKPIYMWSCFSVNNCSIGDLEEYINEIANVLNAYKRYNSLFFNDEDQNGHVDIADGLPYETKIYAILYLVRCTLICRLSNDWDLVYLNEFNEPLGLEKHGSEFWGKLIAIAERGLSRLPLDNDNESAKHYCARILAEAGFPLRSLQNKNSKVVKGLRSIWCLLSSGLAYRLYEKILRDFIANSSSIKYDGPFFWLPGGKSGCRMFFKMGLNLLERVSSECAKRNGKVGKIELLKEFGFENPSEDVVDYIFSNCDSVSFSFPIATKTLLKPIPTRMAPAVNPAFISANKIKPVDWARQHGLKVDVVMKLLCDVGVCVQTHIELVDAVEYRKIEQKADEIKRKAEERSAMLFHKNTTTSAVSNPTSTVSNLTQKAVLIRNGVIVGSDSNLQYGKICEGSRVFHQNYGRGLVEKIYGSGGNACVVVHFDKERSTRSFLLRMALNVLRIVE